MIVIAFYRYFKRYSGGNFLRAEHLRNIRDLDISSELYCLCCRAFSAVLVRDMALLLLRSGRQGIRQAVPVSPAAYQPVLPVYLLIRADKDTRDGYRKAAA